MKYTIKSTSDDGIYYLVNGWEKHKTFWISEQQVQKGITQAREKFFSAPQFAKASLTKLLKIIPDYASDTFELVEI